MATIHSSPYKRLYLYSGLTDGLLAWARDPKDFRDLTRSTSKTIVRVCHRQVDLPIGYRRTGKKFGMANEYIERIPDTYKSFAAGLGL